MEKVTKVLNYCDKYELILSIGDVLKEFFYYNDINFDDRYTFFELLYKNITMERLRQGWYDEKGRPLSNLIKRYIPKDWQKLPKWNDIWSKIVNEIKKHIINQEIEYWEEDVEFFDSEEYNQYSWGDGNSCFRKGNSNEIVKHILKWNKQYAKLGLFEIKKENNYYLGRIWIFKFPNCIIATNMYCRFSDKKELYTYIINMIMEYHKLDKENWHFEKLNQKPFKWFYWNGDAYIIKPKEANINEILNEIKELPLNLKCPHHDCNLKEKLPMRFPILDNGIVKCRKCHIAICSECRKVTHDATRGYDGILCKKCREVCINCGEHINKKEAHYVNGYYYCDDCFHDHFVYCSYCYQPIPRHKARSINIFKCCPDCFDKTFITCAECGDIYRKDTPSTWIKCIGPDGHEKTYCYLCAQDLIKVCSICNRKIHIGWIKQMKNGNLICLDCYGKLCLDDFITGKIKHLNYHEME
ncbi:MAG: hypothetical protein QW068_04570 [Thermoplasmata archaeon]